MRKRGTGSGSSRKKIVGKRGAQVKADLNLIKSVQREVILLGRVNALLNWDEETYMPHEGIKSRGEQAALISALGHEKMISEDLWKALKRLKRAKLQGSKGSMVRKFYKSVSRARKVSRKFVEELSRVTTLGSHAWREARRKKNFKVFQPYLEKIVRLKRQQAKLIGLKGHPYNSLLDDFEEGMTAEKLKPILEKLKVGLIDLLAKIENSEVYRKQKKKLMTKEFDKSAMSGILRDVVSRMGLYRESTRMDLSEHPFTTKIGAGDVRITTAFRKDPMFVFRSTVHEAGHALYELGLPDEQEFTVLGDAPSIGLHESQSRFWENNIARSKSFWKFYFPKFNRVFRLRGKIDDWYREVNFIEPGKIRVESDEVHYCLHVILRFEIELGLIDGSIKVRDLPKVWNAKFKESFGLNVKDDVEGVLQDVHWSQGYIGYFPTYALGSMYAAQLYAALEKKYKRIGEDIAKGDYRRVREWLKEKVHSHGSKMLAEEIMKKATGEGLNPDIYLWYLHEKYAQIYGF